MDILRQSLAVALVFALLWLALWLLRKRNGIRIGLLAAPPGRGPLESLGRLALGPQHALHVVRAGEKELILAIHPHGITVLRDAVGANTHASSGLK
jgi:flagellar biosynthetic protein FliO